LILINKTEAMGFWKTIKIPEMSFTVKKGISPMRYCSRYTAQLNPNKIMYYV